MFLIKSVNKHILHEVKDLVNAIEFLNTSRIRSRANFTHVSPLRFFDVPVENDVIEVALVPSVFYTPVQL
jgi:hypothetical protein